MPQLPTPAATGDVWGNNLNNFLRQLQNGTDGAINHAATRPTKTAADAGFTMVDTTTREIIRWNGTEWVVLMGGTSKGRVSLTGPIELYVRPDGNDSNDGLTNTPTGAFRQIQKAIDVLANAYDIGGFDVTIRVADSGAGFYNSFQVRDTSGTGNVSIIGNETSPSQVVIRATRAIQTNSTSNYTILQSTDMNKYFISGFKFESVGNGDLGVWTTAGTLRIGRVDFGSFPTGIHVTADVNSFIWLTSNYSISGGANAHANSNAGSRVRFGPQDAQGSTTIILSNTPNFTGSFANVSISGFIEKYLTVNFGGTGATGRRFTAGTHGTISVGNGDLNFFPGSIAGIADPGTYGLYV